MQLFPRFPHNLTGKRSLPFKLDFHLFHFHFDCHNHSGLSLFNHRKYQLVFKLPPILLPNHELITAHCRMKPKKRCSTSHETHSLHVSDIQPIKLHPLQHLELIFTLSHPRKSQFHFSSFVVLFWTHWRVTSSSKNIHYSAQFRFRS